MAVDGMPLCFSGEMTYGLEEQAVVAEEVFSALGFRCQVLFAKVLAEAAHVEAFIGIDLRRFDDCFVFVKADTGDVPCAREASRFRRSGLFWGEELHGIE